MIIPGSSPYELSRCRNLCRARSSSVLHLYSKPCSPQYSGRVSSFHRRSQLLFPPGQSSCFSFREVGSGTNRRAFGTLSTPQNNSRVRVRVNQNPAFSSTAGKGSNRGKRNRTFRPKPPSSSPWLRTRCFSAPPRTDLFS